MSKPQGPRVPLGVVHNYKRRAALIERITKKFENRTVKLWGYTDGKLKRVPKDCDLDWVAGPGRETGNSPDLPGVAYHCDVSARPRLGRESIGSYSPISSHRRASKSWAMLLILEADLKQEHCELSESGEATRPAVAEEADARLPDPIAPLQGICSPAITTPASDAGHDTHSPPTEALTELIPKAQPSPDANRPHRARYLGELAKFLAPKLKPYWSKTEDAEIEQQFRQRCDGKGIKLPASRYVIKQIAKIRARLVANPS